MYQCAKCAQRGCTRRDLTKTLPECPSKDEALQQQAAALYKEEENHRIAYEAALVEVEGYGRDPRLVEIMHFLRRCGYEKVGLAFCTGLFREAREVTNILEYNGFTVCSVICKNGAFPKRILGVSDEQCLGGSCDEDVMCNPIGQALFLNREGTQCNIILGLCVGHDTLFIKHSQAPVTVLAVKDRVTGHNPLASIYNAQSYYKKTYYPPKED